jgi:hypothetical protein
MGDDPRPALVARQGIAVSEADEARIVSAGEITATALARVVEGSLFDTEPAHFDRFLAKAGKP